MLFFKRTVRLFLASPVGAWLCRVGAAPSQRLAGRYPNVLTLSIMCLLNNFLTGGRLVHALVRVIQQRRPCNLLIFGFGNDSPFYQKMNAGGRTIFLEDNEKWFRAVMDKFPGIEAYRVQYTTRVSAWQQYLEHPERYATDLPIEVTGIKWDIIFVDAPAGFSPENPGRMESIRLASLLVNRPGDVFVHDCDREVENRFSTLYLMPENLEEEIVNLRHYVFPKALLDLGRRADTS